AGLLHDIGKIGVPEAVLHKRGELDAHEWALMRRHPLTGAQIVSPFEFFATGALTIRHHHERLDGSGYPDGLAGEAIPIGARIVAVADVYDALTSDRPYRTALPREAALEYLMRQAGRTLDGRAVAALVELARENPSVPLWIAWLARRRRLAALGLAGQVSRRALLAAVALGAVLGGHLLVSASLTLGVHIRPDGVAAVLAALAYDAGANVLAAECLFRGALFNRAQRRWSFATALALATAAYVARYLVDPLLPKSVEWVVGAVFYLTLLSAGNCWLFWWSGSLVPGVVSALVFFAAYRLLGTGG